MKMKQKYYKKEANHFLYRVICDSKWLYMLEWDVH